jgi:hypothetical protein
VCHTITLGRSINKITVRRPYNMRKFVTCRRQRATASRQATGYVALCLS